LRHVRPQARRFGFEGWVNDLEAVVDATVEERFVLLCISQGASTAIGIAVRHPEWVSHLILYGGNSRGANHREDPEAMALFNAIVDVLHMGWDSDNPAFQDVFTSRFISDGAEDRREWYRKLCQDTLSPNIAGDLLLARAETSVERILEQVRVSTLVTHVADGAVSTMSETEILAGAFRTPGLPCLKAGTT